MHVELQQFLYRLIKRNVQIAFDMNKASSMG